MKKDFLMPHPCKVVGWIAMPPLIFIWLVFLFFQGADSCKFLSYIQELINVHAGIFIALLAASMLIVAFSRERDEDEYTAAVRSRYLMLAFYIDFLFLVVTAFTVFDLDYLNIMAIQMFLILFLHIVMFNVAMAVIRRRRSRDQ